MNNQFVDEFEPEVAYKLIDGNVGLMGAKLSLPQYMVMFI